ncbi:MAG: LLM class flavin-dependent oxidoreductase [Microbacterium sp.]
MTTPIAAPSSQGLLSSTSAVPGRAPGARDQMVLGVNVLGLGQRPAAWQSPDLNATSFIDRDYWVRVAQEAERGAFDALFLADTPALDDPAARPSGALEPSVLLAAVAAATTRIGLVGTLTSTYNDPVDLAARVLTLDLASGGRAGWNVVTTASPHVGANFGVTDGLDRDSRYARAEEFVAFVTRLWESTREVPVPAAFGGGSARLDLPLAPSGRPTLVQAGGSPAGRALAARRADAVFTAEMTLDAALEHYATVKRLAATAGRDPNEVTVLPGFALVIGSTHEEAVRLYDEWEALGPPDYSLRRLSGMLGIDATDIDLDEPLPDWVTEVPEDQAGFASSLSFRSTTVRFARAHGLTVRELLRQYGGYGHPIIVGTPEDVADTLETWFRAGAADGFNLMPPVFPSGLTTLIDEVLPLLRARGLFRHEYEDATLRGRLARRKAAAR